MSKRTRNILVIALVSVIIVAGGILAFVYRDRISTAVGTQNCGPGCDVSWSVNYTATNLNNASSGDNINAASGDTINFSIDYSVDNAIPQTAGGFFSGAQLFIPTDNNLINFSAITGGGVVGSDAYSSRQGIVWSLGNLTIPTSSTVSFSAEVKDPITVSQFTTTAEFVSGELPPPATSTITINVQAPPVGGTPNLTMVKNVEDVNGAPVERGDLLKYTLTLENTGQATATGIQAVEDIPAKLEQFSVPVISKPAGAVDSSAATGGANGTGLLDINSFSLLPTESSTIVYTVVVSNAAKDKEVIDNVATATYTQSPNPLTAEVQVAVSVSAGPVVIPTPTPTPTPNPNPNPTPTPTQNPTPVSQSSTDNPISTTDGTITTQVSQSAGANNTQSTSTPTQAVIVPQVGVDPSLIALGGSGAVSLLVGAGYYLRRKKHPHD